MNLSDTTTEHQGLMDLQAVQQVLHRSRASIYRYANTDPHQLNPPYNPKRLNPELRFSKTEPLLFHPNEVARFARDILGLQPVTIEVQPSPTDATLQVLHQILEELRAIHALLQSRT